MSKELNEIDIFEISSMIENVVSVYGNDAIHEILDGLLKARTHELLIDIIRNKANSNIKNQSQNNYFIVGLSVYRYVYDNECSMKIAESHVSEQSYLDEKRKAIKVNTVKTHKDAFVKKIKEDMIDVCYKYTEIKTIPSKDVKEFINNFFIFFDKNNISWNNDSLKNSDYLRVYRDYIVSLHEDTIPF